MPYAMFCRYFPKIAERQTRVITVIDGTEFDLPAGEYVFAEMYCDEKGCACRRVMFSVIYNHKRIAATIAYGWESADFYARWMGDDAPDMIEQLKGPTMCMLGPQSDKSEQILEMFEKQFLNDWKYVEHLKEHYRMFRQRIDKRR